VTIAQIVGSLAVWLLYAVWVARRMRTAAPLALSRAKAALLAAGLIVGSTALALSGLYLSLPSSTQIKILGFKEWLCITLCGWVFVAGQAEAVGLLVRVLIPRGSVTPEAAQSSSSSGPSQKLS
jgi:hypothetical protein